MDRKIIEVRITKKDIVKCLNKIVSTCNLKEFSFEKNYFKLILSKECNDASEELILRAFRKCINSYNISQHNVITHRPIFFIDKRTNIPLIGSSYFGIIDRGNTLLQIRPITGCYLNCIYCSVDEGPISHTRVLDYMIDRKYLVEVFRNIVEYKKSENIEAHIDGQGEPTTYPYIIDLIKDLRNTDNVSVISMQTNGVTLSRKFIDNLINAGLDRLNVSINAINNETAKTMANVRNYNINVILENLKYANEQGLHILIAPVWINKFNDKDIEEIIEFAKKYIKPVGPWPVLGIQKYEVYRYGRKVKSYKEIPYNVFYKQLKLLEIKHKIKPLILNKQHFGITKAKRLPLMFKKYEIVDIDFSFPGRFNDEIMGVARDRVIHIRKVDPKKLTKIRKVRILHTRHNIYFARAA